MRRQEDTFTSTVDAAAAFERWHGEDYLYDDKPDLSDVLGGDWDERDAAQDEPEDEQ